MPDPRGHGHRHETKLLMHCASSWPVILPARAEIDARAMSHAHVHVHVHVHVVICMCLIVVGSAFDSRRKPAAAQRAVVQSGLHPLLQIAAKQDRHGMPMPSEPKLSNVYCTAITRKLQGHSPA